MILCFQDLRDKYVREQQQLNGKVNNISITVLLTTRVQHASLTHRLPQ